MITGMSFLCRAARQEVCVHDQLLTPVIKAQDLSAPTFAAGSNLGSHIVVGCCQLSLALNYDKQLNYIACTHVVNL